MRRIVAQTGIGWDAPAPFEPNRSLAEALLTPTRLYVKPLLAALKATEAICALAHVTGGGFPDNLPRVLPTTLAVRLDLSAFTPPPVFGWLAAEGPVARGGDAAHLQLRDRHGRLRAPRGRRRGGRGFARGGTGPVEIGRLVAREDAAVIMDGRLAL